MGTFAIRSHIMRMSAAPLRCLPQRQTNCPLEPLGTSACLQLPRASGTHVYEGSRAQSGRGAGLHVHPPSAIPLRDRVLQRERPCRSHPGDAP